MSILIKGMEMPQGNSTINVLIYADGTVYTGHVNDSQYSAVSVHTPHGRLGDLDKLNIHDISPVDGFCVMGVTEEDIELADTVIEGSETWLTSLSHLSLEYSLVRAYWSPCRA